jgi:hypothetical protein
MLERATTRHEAAEVTAHILKTYGQGGNCELRGNSHFDGSFIVADKTGALVLETAGQDWATREVTHFASISNGYTIGTDWTATSLTGQVDFAATVGDPAPSIACGAPERRAASHDWLNRHKGTVDVRSMVDLMRHTGDEGDYHPTNDERPTRVCMHAGPYPGRFWQATGSLVSDVRGESIVVWATGTSGPDSSSRSSLACRCPILVRCPVKPILPGPIGGPMNVCTAA